MRIRTDASCLVARVDGRKVLVYIYINWDQPNAHKHHAMGKGKACGWTGARILQGSSPHRVKHPRECKNMQNGLLLGIVLSFAIHEAIQQQPVAEGGQQSTGHLTVAIGDGG